GGVEVLDVAVGGDLLTVLVHQEDDLGVRVDPELRDDLLDLVELLLVHDDIWRRHPVILLKKPYVDWPCADGSPQERIVIAWGTSKFNPDFGLSSLSLVLTPAFHGLGPGDLVRPLD